MFAQRPTPFSRREAIRLGLTASAGVLLYGCQNEFDEDAVREFTFDNAVKWEPANLYQDFAFTVLQDLGMDFVDSKCVACGRAIRVFFTIHAIEAALLIPCPGCSAAIHVTLIVSTLLLAQMKSYAFHKALAFLKEGSYRVKKVGPLTTRGKEKAVARAAICYDVEGHEPTGEFERKIAAVPRQICYFTEVKGDKYDDVVHVWRCNNNVMDRISLDVGSHRWRTFSRKLNVQSGLWVVTAETTGGAILDSREFHIA